METTSADSLNCYVASRRRKNVEATMGQKHGVDLRGKIRTVTGSPSMGRKHIVESSGGGGGEIVHGPWQFDDLPEDCISKIISFTSPRDACVSASVSKSFQHAGQSDSIWEKFLPSEYASLVPPWRTFSSKKELYFTLCYDPVLIEDGKKSFWLETASGKKCVLLAATELWITGGNNPEYWQWVKLCESSFEKVPELLNNCAFEMGGSMSTEILSLGTYYSAYIVYKIKDERHGLRDLPIQVGVGFKGQEMPKQFICFDESSTDETKEWPKKELIKSKKRGDGWMEAEIGDFFNDGGLMGFDEIEVSIVDVTSPNLKCGVIIEGIEFRPTDSDQ